jgi:hypothetical protein
VGHNAIGDGLDAEAVGRGVVEGEAEAGAVFLSSAPRKGDEITLWWWAWRPAESVVSAFCDIVGETVLGS